MSPTHEASLGPALDFLRQLWQLNHALEQLSSRMERRLGVTAQQRLIIRCIGRMPGITAGRLAEVMHVDPGTISAALRRLEHKRIARRARDPHDARRVLVELTRRGRALDRPVDGSVEHAVEVLLASAATRNTRAASKALAQLTTLLDKEASDAVRLDRRAPGQAR